MIVTECRRVQAGARVATIDLPPYVLSGGLNPASMTNVTRILQQVDAGDPDAAEQLLPLVYEELRKLAAARMAAESPDHTLQATALVHEAYLRLVGGDEPQHWDGRGHFFAAAAEAMRRILVEKARHKSRLKHGGDVRREHPELSQLAAPETPEEVLAVHEALDRLKAAYPEAARLVTLRYFLGMTIPEAADALAISPRKADQLWSYARVWLMDAIQPVAGV
jgi:RNA polymerase sigma factor (TIGR02999 family)